MTKMNSKTKKDEHTILKLPKFTLDSSLLMSGNGGNGGNGNKSCIHLVNLYNRVYCVAIDHLNMSLNVIDVAGSSSTSNNNNSSNSGGNTSGTGTTVSSVARSFPLYGEGAMFLSTIDHLLCVHVPTIKVTLVYDIASEGDRPVASPMSLVCVPPSSSLHSTTNNNSSSTTNEDETLLYFDPYDNNVCTPIWPNYYIRTISSVSNMSTPPLSISKDIWSLRVNLVEALRCSFGSSPGVVAGFLMRRNDDGYISEDAKLRRILEGKKEQKGTFAKSLLLTQLLSSAKQSVDLGKLVSAFNVLCRVYRIALTERTRTLGKSNQTGSSTITTDDSKRKGTLKMKFSKLCHYNSCNYRKNYFYLFIPLLMCSLKSYLSIKPKQCILTSLNFSTNTAPVVAFFIHFLEQKIVADLLTSSVLAEEHTTKTRTATNGVAATGSARNPTPHLQRRVSMASPMTTYQSIRTNGGMIVVLQRDIFKHVLQPMMMDTTISDT